MAKGICCALQAAGRLGDPVVVTMKNGSKRCGVCEVRPSCRDPQKLVFAFRFLKGLVCKLPGASACAPTAAGVAQYNQVRTQAAVSGASFEIADQPGYPALPYPAPHPHYQLPLS